MRYTARPDATSASVGSSAHTQRALTVLALRPGWAAAPTNDFRGSSPLSTRSCIACGRSWRTAPLYPTMGALTMRHVMRLCATWSSWSRSNTAST